MAENWTIEAGVHGSLLVMHGPWSTAALQNIRDAGIKEVELNYAKGWSGHDYSFLRELPDLAAVEITDWNTRDIGAVNNLATLRRLKVFTYCRTEIRFSQLPLLEECSLEWRPKASSLFEHTRLKKLFINKYPAKTLTAFSKMTDLRSLSLASPKIETLNGIGALSELSFLGVYVARRLGTLNGIEALTNLVQLEVNDCPRIRNISPLGGLHLLREVHLCNDGDIETLGPLRRLEKLEVLLFYESTNVLDGDLSVLQSLAKLQHVVFMGRPHYSHGRGDLPQRRSPQSK